MSNIFGLQDSDLNEIIQVLKTIPQVKEAIIFGSRAKGTFKKGSDVDIVLKGEAINHSILNRISYILNEETFMPYQFDILHFNGITNPDLLEHIHRVGKTFYKE